jgi:plasmid stability protein
VASITISQIDEPTLERLRLRAADHGRSVEEEAVEILKSAVPGSGLPGNLWQRIRRRVEPFGGFDLPEIERDPIREPPAFD